MWPVSQLFRRRDKLLVLPQLASSVQEGQATKSQLRAWPGWSENIIWSVLATELCLSLGGGKSLVKVKRAIISLWIQYSKPLVTWGSYISVKSGHLLTNQSFWVRLAVFKQSPTSKMLTQFFFLSCFQGGRSFPNNLNQILGWSRMSSSWFTFLSNQSNILYVSVIKLVSQSDQTDIVQQSFLSKQSLFPLSSYCIWMAFLSCVNMYFRD